MKPRWVPQSDPMGCGPACLAMLTGHPYPKVAKRFPQADLWEEGTSSGQLDTYLAESGYAVARIKWHVAYKKWPPKPQANLNLAVVTPDLEADCDHYVVVLKNGDVLDPAVDATPRKLSDYFAVKELVAVVRL